MIIKAVLGGQIRVKTIHGDINLEETCLNNISDGNLK
jgi:hypothetical protein